MKNVARIGLVLAGVMCLSLTACKSHDNMNRSQMDSNNQVASADDACAKGSACCHSKENVAKADMAAGEKKDCCGKDMKDMKPVNRN